jgi:Rrf2 family protein
MKLSTRTRYGVRLMAALAAEYSQKPLFLKDIAAREEISEKYLSLIVIPLRASGLIKSLRGAHGGYTLAQDPCNITLYNIVEALEGEICLVRCVKQPTACNRAAICPTRDIWSIVGDKIKESLNGITLTELLKLKKEKIKKNAKSVAKNKKKELMVAAYGHSR